MKLIYSILFTLFLTLFCVKCMGGELNDKSDTKTDEKSFVEKNGKLFVEGTNLKNENGETIVLKGVSYGWHNWWPRFYNESTVEHFINEWNCTVVRAAMGVDPKRGYIEDPEFAMDCITKVIDAAIKNGIYVIIDWHSHTIRKDEAIDFFKTIATKYKEYPNIIYEIFNEPERDSWSDIKAYSEDVIKVIRALDPNNIILVGSPHWDQDIHIVADDPIEGYDNIMYTLHFYASTHGKFLRDRGDYAIEKGLSLFVTECAGMEATGDGAIDYKEWQNWIDWMDKNDISWVAWSVSDKDETCSMLEPTAASFGNWEENDLKEWGKIIKKELKLE